MTSSTSASVGSGPASSDAPQCADLDHSATTRVRAEVLAAMAPFEGERYGNPSGSHLVARDVVRAIDEAREEIAEIIGCAPGEIIFTSGGTEADNHALTGGMPPRPGIPVCSAVEHHAVADVVKVLGGRVVDVDSEGRVDLDHLAATLEELGSSASVISVMLANNEIGTINDLDEVEQVIARVLPDVPRPPLHTDAVQAAAWLDLRETARVADMITVSAHKLGGPKGIGALVVREPATIRPLIIGGGQERGRRSGTPNVSGIIGLAAALRLIEAERDVTTRRVSALRDRLGEGLAEQIPGLRRTVVGPVSKVLPGTCHVCIDGVDSESMLLLMEMGGVMASAGSSCSSGARETSPVLDAIGVSAELAEGALRFSLGSDTTESDVDLALEVVPAAVRRVRSFLS